MYVLESGEQFIVEYKVHAGILKVETTEEQWPWRAAVRSQSGMGGFPLKVPPHSFCFPHTSRALATQVLSMLAAWFLCLFPETDQTGDRKTASDPLKTPRLKTLCIEHTLSMNVLGEPAHRFLVEVSLFHPYLLCSEEPQGHLLRPLLQMVPPVFCHSWRAPFSAQLLLAAHP